MCSLTENNDLLSVSEACSGQRLSNDDAERDSLKCLQKAVRQAADLRRASPSVLLPGGSMSVAVHALISNQVSGRAGGYIVLERVTDWGACAAAAFSSS